MISPLVDRTTRLMALWLSALAMALAMLLVGGPASAQDREPLLMEGKQTIHQRVLSRPNAIVRVAPEAAALVANDEVPTFTVWYVFNRRIVDGQEWLEIGSPLRGPAEGWVPADRTIAWRQTMVVSFNNSAGRERTLFFSNREPLIDLMESQTLASQSRALRDQAINGTLPPGSPVIAIEPETPPDITQEFYLLPILDAERVWTSTGFEPTVLRVASIPLATEPVEQQRSREEILRDFKVGIVFVIDTTISMDPYIERTRAAVRQIYQQIQGSEIGDRVSFGMVGYRDNIEGRPELGYVTQVYAPLEAGRDPDEVLDDMGQVGPAEVSTRGFDEDAMAGMKAALDMPGWGEFGGRYIVLITDAGARASGDPLGATGLGPSQINTLARENKTAIYAMHLLTQEGAGNHPHAEGQYRELSNWPNAGSLYHPVPLGSVTQFGDAVDQLAQSLIDQIEETMNNRVTEVNQNAQTALQRQAQLVGRAMQLAYLGSQGRVRAPEVFEAWTADRDLDDPQRASLEVRVLLTKNQLSDLRDVLRAILEAGQAARISPEEFFDQLRSAAANLSRNPNQLGQQRFENLGELLGEYLDDLPYTSQIMEIDQRAWLSMGAGRQREILDGIAAKLRLYDDLDRQPQLWTALYEGAPEGEKVFPVPLEQMP